MTNACGVKNLLVCEVEAFNWIDYDDYYPYQSSINKLIQVRYYNDLGVWGEDINDRVIKVGWKDRLTSLKEC